MLFQTLLTYIVAFFGLFTTVYFLLILIENRKQLTNPKPIHGATISIIIPARNEEVSIIRTLENIGKLQYPKDKLEVIVVDNNSTDNTFQLVQEYIKKAKFSLQVFKESKPGKNHAVNLGLEKAKGEFVSTLDADCFPESDCLKKMMGYFRDQQTVGVTASLSVYNPKGFWLRLQHVEYTLGIFLRKVFSLVNALHVIPGAFSLYRKAFFDKFGGFKSAYHTEDIELALRIQTIGYKITNSVDAKCFAVSPHSFKGLLLQRMRWYYGFVRNIWDYKHLFKWHYGDMAILLLPAALISVILTLTSFFYIIYLNVDIIRLFLIRQASIGFDTSSWFNIELNKVTNFISGFVTGPTIFFFFISVVLLLTVVFLGKKYSKETRSLALGLFYFFLIYWVFYAVWWFAAIVYKSLTHKKLTWEKGERRV
ncbi:MAG: glycosyltransferase [archaeon]